MPDTDKFNAGKCEHCKFWGLWWMKSLIAFIVFLIIFFAGFAFGAYCGWPRAEGHYFYRGFPGQGMMQNRFYGNSRNGGMTPRVFSQPADAGLSGGTSTPATPKGSDQPAVGQ